MAFVTNTNAQTWVTIPDANFVTYLQALIPAAMSGNQLNTSSTLVTSTTHSISVGGRSIADLSGIQYFTSLTYLICYNNSLTNLPTFPNTLTSLNCEGNQLTSLPTLPNSLLVLNCGYNSLTNLPVLPNSLQTLWCHYNSLTTLPALPNTLSYLYCDSNDITCFPTFPNSITTFSVNNNSFNCFPNYIAAMGNDTTIYPLCAAGNSNGCAVAGIEQYNVNDGVNIYPNPTKDVLNVECEMVNEKTTLTLADMMGNTVKQMPFTTQHLTLNITDLSEGVYNLSIKTNEGVLTKKVVVQR